MDDHHVCVMKELVSHAARDRMLAGMFIAVMDRRYRSLGTWEPGMDMLGFGPG
jgi:hypothetical protein